MEPYDVYEHDVLVIGAGGAGLRAAISVREAGLSCGVVCKSLLGKAHTVMAEGGAAAALNNMGEGDGWKTHFKDTMLGGQYLNNPRTVEIFAKEAIDRVLELEEYGAVFDRTPQGFIAQRPFGGHTYRRLNHVGDRTGLELIRTVQDKAVSMRPNIYMEVTLTRLLKDGDRIIGAFGYDRATGKFVTFHAKAVILATGGWGRMYKFTSNSWESTGDGAAMALEAGAELMDMEMVQFHPTGMLWPPGVRGILVTEAVRGEGGILRNKDGERFMFKDEYMPPHYKGKFAETPEEAARWLEDKDKNRRPPELLPRDVVARAIYKEVKAGRGTEHGGAHLDVTHRGADYIRKKLPSMFEQFHALGDIDITRQPMEIYPTIHYTMGGIRAEPDSAESSIKGLFAAGECSAGLHGANRLGGNSLTDILVFGKRAGDHAAQYASGASVGKINDAQIDEEQAVLLDPFTNKGSENPYGIAHELQEAMQAGAMIERVEKGLAECLEKVLSLKKRAANIHIEGDRCYNPGWHTARDVRFQIILSEAICRCALERKESRGAQWRSDYPDKDDAHWGKLNQIATLKNGEVSLATRPVPEMSAELKEALEA
jgi:succinate dehydrogenase / fumarate reductase flavoprotein subunit